MTTAAAIIIVAVFVVAVVVTALGTLTHSRGNLDETQGNEERR